MNISITKCLFVLVVITFSCKENTYRENPEKIWKRHIIDSTLKGADGVRLLDVNNDSLMDIATGWEESGITKIYLHPGYDKVKDKWPSVVVGKTPSVEDAVFADIDNDGFFDVISSTEGDDKSIYINWAPNNSKSYLDSKQWASEIIPASQRNQMWMFTLPVQIDKSFGVDIVAGSKGNNAEVGWFQSPKNSRDLYAWKYYPISPATWIMSIVAEDVDNDGDLDLVITDRKPGSTQGLRWLENPGDSIKQTQYWKSHFIGAENLEVMFLDIADIDGDGLNEIITTETTNNKIHYFKKLDKSGQNWKQYQIDIPFHTGTPKAVKVGDINMDGNMDIVYSSENAKNKTGLIWLAYEDSVTDEKWKWYDISGVTGIKYDLIKLIDIDGDGDLDILTCEERHGKENKGLGVIWYENPTF